MILAEHVLDVQPYRDGIERGITWEDSSLRNWLNTTFYNETFSEEEKGAIKDTTVTNLDNPMWNGLGGNTTTDKVYLLSYLEAKNRYYGFCGAEKSSATRAAKQTAYCINRQKSGNTILATNLS